jgi:ribosomal protein S27AE
MARKPVTPRTVRRTQERAAVKLARDRERLAALEAGGAPSRPVEVQSASQVEPHALAAACLRCGGSNRLEEHGAVSDDEGQLLRVARLRCGRCGASRAMWFRITPRALN